MKIIKDIRGRIQYSESDYNEFPTSYLYEGLIDDTFFTLRINNADFIDFYFEPYRLELDYIGSLIKENILHYPNLNKAFT